MSLSDFLLSIEAEKHLLLHSQATPYGKEVTGLAGLYRRAVRNAVRDAQLPHRTRRSHGELLPSREISSPEPGPLGALTDAEEVQKIKTLMTEAMKHVVRDPTDKAIIRLLYFGRDEINQAEVARRLGISPAQVSKRLTAVKEALLSFIHRKAGTY